MSRPLVLETELKIRTLRVLASYRITTVDDLRGLSDDEAEAMKGMGAVGLAEIRRWRRSDNRYGRQVEP